MLRGPALPLLLLLTGCAPSRPGAPTVDVEAAAGEAPTPPPPWAADALALSVRAALVLGGGTDQLDQSLAALAATELAGWRAHTVATLAAWSALPEAERPVAVADLAPAILGDLDGLTDALSYSPALLHTADGPPGARLPSTAARLLEDQQLRAFPAAELLLLDAEALALELSDPARLAPEHRAALMLRLEAHASAVLRLQVERLAGLALVAAYMAPDERTTVVGGPLVARWLLLTTGMTPTPG